MPALSVLADTAHPVHACALHTSILYVNTIHQYVRVYINTLRATRCTPGARCSQRKLVGSALPVTRPDVASRARRGSRNARWSKRLRGSDGHGIGPLREIWCVGLCARGAALPPGRGRFKRRGSAPSISADRRFYFTVATARRSSCLIGRTSLAGVTGGFSGGPGAEGRWQDIFLH